MAKSRRERLLEIVRRQGFASLSDLVEALGVSESTVRRDLAHLEQKGIARRTHGGAYYTGPTPHLAHFQQRQAVNWDLKKGIAAEAVLLIQEGDTVLLDGGSTTYELARLLTRMSLQVVTNSLPVANLFSAATNIDLVLVGGYVHHQSGAIHGPYAEKMLASLRGHKAIISAAGVNEHGLYNSNHMLAATQRAMVGAAEEVIVLVDSSKLGHQSLAPICRLDEIDHLVVDDQLDSPWQEKIRAAGVDLKLASLVVPRLPSSGGKRELVDPLPGNQQG